MSLISQAFLNLNEFNMWLGDQSGKSLTLADFPEIIPLRWNYFRDNWEFILDSLIEKQSSFDFPDILGYQINSLGKLIRAQRHKANIKTNPFSKKTIQTDYYTVWENIDITSISLTKEEQSIVDDKLSRIRRFIKTDFVRIRQSLMDARDNIADTVGLSDVDYNTAFNRSSAAQLRSVKIQDVIDMQTFQESISSIDLILANTASLVTLNIDPFALAKANANNPDIEIVAGKSGQLVKMFFGDSLPSLANRHLGNSDRWIEIAIANGLKPPYIDEIGSSVFISSNGSESQLSVSKLDMDGKPNIEKFYVNQVIFLQSNTIKFSDQRSILSIKEVPISGEIVIELNGESNLDQYKVADDAYIRVFKPNTINSNFLITIPSSQEVSSTSTTKETPFFLTLKSEDEKRAGVDLLIDGSGDLILSQIGDFQLSYGITNSLQAIQLKMASERGQLRRHPNYGLPSVIGLKMTDKNAIKQTLVTGITNIIASDKRFSRVETLNVSIEQGSAIISLVVRLAGSGSLIPISFTINTG